MKKKLILSVLGFVMAGLLSAVPASAFSYLDDLKTGYKHNGYLKSSDPTTEGTWLKTLPGVSSLTSYVTKHQKPDKDDYTSDVAYQTALNQFWGTSFDYDSTTGSYYVILKTGNLNAGLDEDYRWFAFSIGDDTYDTYYDILVAMMPLLNKAYGLTWNINEWKDKASHFSVFLGSTVPIPGAVWLSRFRYYGTCGNQGKIQKKTLITFSPKKRFC